MRGSLGSISVVLRVTDCRDCERGVGRGTLVLILSEALLRGDWVMVSEI